MAKPIRYMLLKILKTYQDHYAWSPSIHSAAYHIPLLVTAEWYLARKTDVTIIYINSTALTESVATATKKHLYDSV